MLNTRLTSRRRHSSALLLTAPLTALLLAGAPGQAAPAIHTSYSRLPLSFERAPDASARGARFLARGSGYGLFLTGSEAILSLASQQMAPQSTQEILGRRAAFAPAARSSAAVLRMKLLGANATPRISGINRLPGVSNYFIGNDPAQWRTQVPQYGRIKYSSVYRGIDLVYYGNQRQLEYDFIVSPGADPRRIHFAIQGARHVGLGARGDLILDTGSGRVVQHAPVVYQEVSGVRKPVAGHYVLRTAHHARSSTRQIGFRIGRYDHRRPLIIDPVLLYSSYFGGSAFDKGYGIAYDAAGNILVAGHTFSTNLPVKNAAQPKYVGGGNIIFGGDAFVAKLNAAGSALVYCTYLGGNNFDFATAIAVDGSGNACVAGQTTSTDFPTKNAFQTAKRFAGNTDTFVVKLTAGGSLVYSTYLGGIGIPFGTSTIRGNTLAWAIAADRAGNAYVAGQNASNSFPLKNALSSFADNGAFVTKFTPTGALAYSTLLAGKAEFDRAFGVAVDGLGQAWVAGATNAPDFPTRNAIQPHRASTVNDVLSDFFVVKLNATGNARIFSTYLGGSLAELDWVSVAVDGLGNGYIGGLTQSTDFPTSNAFQAIPGPGANAVIAKFSPTGSLLYSTYTGGAYYVRGIAVDRAGDAFITGQCLVGTLQTVDSRPPDGGAALGLGADGFVTALNASGSALLYSTYFGGKALENGESIAVDAAGNAVVTGVTGSLDFPTFHPFQAHKGGAATASTNLTGEACDAFIIRFGQPNPPPNYTVSGRITRSGNPLFKATVALRSGTNTPLLTTTDGNGNYGFAAVPDGTYTVTPSFSVGSTTTLFTPASRTVTISNHIPVTHMDFATLARISGLVTDDAGRGIDSVTITRSGTVTTADSHTVLTQGGGYYTLMNVPAGTYTITPSYPGVNTHLVFTPASRTVTVTTRDIAGMDFVGAVPVPPTPTPIPGSITSGKIAFDTFRSDQGGSNKQIYVMFGNGTNLTRLTRNTHNDVEPCLRLDGSKIVFSSDRDQISFGIDRQIYIMNADGSGQTRLTHNTNANLSPSFRPDGLKIAYVSGPFGSGQIWMMNADGSGPLQTTHLAQAANHPTWRPDGGAIAFDSFYSGSNTGGYRIFVVPASGGTPTPLATSGGYANDMNPAWSPDGRRIAFFSNRQPGSQFGGSFQVWVMNSDGSGLAQVTHETNSLQASSRLAWSLDSTKIVYASSNGLTVINSNGTGKTQVTTASTDENPTWARATSGLTSVAVAAAQSSVAVSAATASALTGTVQLRFGTAVDAISAGDAAHYAVMVNGRSVAVQSASYNARTNSVTLALPDGALRAGDKVAVRWSGLLDGNGRDSAGATGPFIAR